MLKLLKLKREGALNCGDTVEHSRLGICTVATIESFHTIVLRNAADKYFRVSGLSFGPDARVFSR